MNTRASFVPTPDAAGHSVRPRRLIPRWLRTRGSLAVTTVVAAAALTAPSAWAAAPQTYCVHQAGSSCPAGAVDEGSDLQTALDDAAANNVSAGSANTVTVGTGTYVAPPHGFVYGSDNALRLTGAGDGTTLTTGPDTYSVLSAGNAGGTVALSGLNIVVTSASGTGLTLTGGAADHIAITTTQPQDTGAVIGDSTLSSSSVHGTADASTDVSATRAVLNDDTIQGGNYGVRAIGFTTIHRTSIDSQWGIAEVAGAVFIDDSLVKAGLVGLSAQDSLNEGSINALNDTLIGSGGVGIQASSTSTNGVEVQILNSIISGFPVSFDAKSQGGGAATILAETDSYDGTAEGGGVSTSDSMSGAPGFVNPARGDYHLAADSPLIDASATQNVGSLSSTTDLDGHPRVVSVTHPGTPVDLGAYEYQPPAADSNSGGGNPGGGTPGGGNPGGGTPGGGSPGTGTPGSGTPGTGNHSAGTPGTSTPLRGSRPTKPATLKLIALGRLAGAGNRMTLRLSCTGTAACTGISVKATAMDAHHRKVTVGSLGTRLRAGRKATLTLWLNRAGRALLATQGRLAVTLAVTVRDGKRTRTVETVHTTLHRLP